MSRTFTTHKPSGKPSWPIVLFAGAEKTGKSWEAAAFSGSDLIGRTFWFQLGENIAEEYGAVPGARYEIVDYDGSYRELCAAAEQFVAEPRVDGKPNAIVIDSITILWDMLSSEQQQIALRRRKPGANGEAKVTVDQWNAAKDRWNDFLDILRRNDGPVILLARMDLVTLVDDGGQPTKAKDWKIKAEKNLPYAVGVIVSMPVRGEAWLSGLHSTRLLLQPGEKRRLDGFSLDRLLREMGLADDDAVAPRQYTAPRPDADEAMADAGPQRPAERHRGRVEDEWQTPPADGASGAQLEDIAGGLRAVRGLTGDGPMLAAVSELIGRQITDPRQLTAAEADTVLTKLRAEDAARQATAPAESVPDQVPAAPAGPTPNDPEMSAARQRMMHGLFREKNLVAREQKVPFIERVLGYPIESMGKLTRSQGEAIITALTSGEIPAPANAPHESAALTLAERIDNAATSDELADAGEAAWQAKTAGSITDAQHTALMDRSMAREQELSAAIRQAREAVAA